MIARRYIIEGLVQGVGFRWYVHREATALGLRGTVRNLRDGRVEVEAGGSADDLQAFEKLLWRGPFHAHVTHVRVQPWSIEDDATTFTIEG